MKFKFLVTLLMFFVSFVASGQVRTEYLLTKNWKFTKGDVPNGKEVGFNDSQWETVTVPHDWAIKGPFDGNIDLQKVKIVQNGEKAATLKSGRTGGLPFIGVGWYRTKFAAPAFNKKRKPYCFLMAQ